MTKECLDPAQRRTLKIIEALGFGAIEHLSIRDGLPCYEPEPRIVQTIKLGSDSDQVFRSDDSSLTLKKELEDLFSQLGRIQAGVVDIEVRHGLPFRLVLARRCIDLVAGQEESCR